MIDHIGLAPISVMNDYNGHIYCTAPTIELARLILTDSAFIQAKECEKYNKTKKGKKDPLYPIYGQVHVENCLERFRGYDYDKPLQLTDNIKVVLKPTGHLLGACSVYIEVRCDDEVKTLLFTGDTSAKEDVPFTKVANFDKLKVNYLFSESTYGNRKHIKADTNKEIERIIIETCIKKQGQLMIPSFAVGRSTTILSRLFDIYNANKKLYDIPIYLVSPMACKAHRIYGAEDSFNFYGESSQRYKELYQWGHINYIDNYQDVCEKLFNSEPKIIISSSGMIQAGYSVAVAEGLLSNKKNTILFIGYQGFGTTGRDILESDYESKISINDKFIKRKCDIESINMSSHADKNQMISLYKDMQTTKLKKVFLNHGDENSLDVFKNEIERELCKNVIVSAYNRTYTL